MHIPVIVKVEEAGSASKTPCSVVAVVGSRQREAGIEGLVGIGTNLHASGAREVPLLRMSAFNFSESYRQTADAFYDNIRKEGDSRSARFSSPWGEISL